jgi:hypothetical protein
MKQAIGLILIVAFLVSCGISPSNNASQKMNNGIEGTWKLISGTTITGSDTTVTDYTKEQSMIKIINKTHFAFLRHDLNMGKDTTAVYESGGGHYTLVGEQYTEYLDYCNYREWEGSSFQFTVSLKNDSLVQRGIEKVDKAGIDRVITETYTRIKK